MIRHYLNNRVRWLRDLPSRLALKAFNHGRVREWLGEVHARAVAGHLPLLPVLGEFERRIVCALETDGVFITSLDALQLSGAQTLLQVAGELAMRFAPRARELARSGEEFIIVPPENVAGDPAIYRFGLQDRLLDIAEAYIGLPVAYDGVAINYTVADGREISTRRWHRDWEDRRMLKVAVYLHDVDDNGGPFQLVRRYDGLQTDARGFEYDLANDEEMARKFGASFARDVLSCEGPRGTVIFSDTARFFHRGKPATARDRAALFYSYFANPPRHPFLCERTGLSRSQIQRLAEGLPERQRSAALWQKDLPGLLRLVPPAGI